MKTNIYAQSKIALILIMCFGFTSLGFASVAKTAWGWTLNCPSNVYVSCSDELWDLSIYGNATYTYQYQTYSAGSPTVTYNLNSCNSGTITRTWTVEDNNWVWHTCTQTIFVSSSSSGGPNIVWPLDLELEGCNPNTNPNQLQPPYNTPTWTDSECGMLGKSYSDMVFTVNSQCKKIMRTWKVLDWCQYSPTNGYGIYTKVQYIYIISKVPPALNCVPEIVANATNCKNAVVTAAPLAIDPNVCGGVFEVTNNSPYATSKGNNISGTYPIGTTKVTYTVKYGCNLLKTCVTNVVVKNANVPTPYCVGSLVTALMGVDTNNDGKVDNGMVQLWAKDLDRGSKSICNNYPLKFSFSKDVTETSKTFTCDNIGKNNVEMWITDSKGAQTYCIVVIDIQNNGANIPDCKPKPVVPIVPIYSVKGSVLTATDFPLKNAEVTLTYKNPIVTYTSTFDTTEVLKLDSFINASGYKLYRYKTVLTITEKKDSVVVFTSKKVKTNATGNYLFDSLTVHNKPVSLTATFADEIKRGIDSKDVELLTKFLLGEVTFTSYYQYLASDIDENGKIDIQDQNILMEFVTGTRANLPGVHQWYVLDAKATFTKPQDVLLGNLPYAVSLDSIAKVSPAVGFVGIKKGNISIDPGTQAQGEVVARSRTNSADQVKAYPNPFGSTLSFDIESATDQGVVIRLMNANGQLIHQEQKTVTQGQNNINLQLTNEVYGLMFYQVSMNNKQYSGMLSRIK